MNTVIFRTAAPYIAALMVIFSIFVLCAATTSRAAVSSAA
jgi:hypothetical protein